MYQNKSLWSSLVISFVINIRCFISVFIRGILYILSLIENLCFSLVRHETRSMMKQLITSVRIIDECKHNLEWVRTVLYELDWTAFERVPDWRSVYTCPEEVCHVPNFIMELLGLHKFVHGNFFVAQHLLCAHRFLHFTVTVSQNSCALSLSEFVENSQRRSCRGSYQVNFKLVVPCIVTQCE